MQLCSLPSTSTCGTSDPFLLPYSGVCVLFSPLRAVPEFIDMWNEQPTNGSKGEGVACGMRNTGTFQALKDVGVQAIYSG